MYAAIPPTSDADLDDLGARKLTIADTAIAILLAAGYGTPLVALVTLAGAVLGRAISSALFGLPLALSAFFGLVIWIRRLILAHGRRRFQIAAEVLVLVVLPVWGTAYSHIAEASCVVSACGGPDTFRPLAEPEVFVLLALHAVTALAYAISRRRPEALPPLVEATVHGAMLLGIGVHAVLAVQLGPWLLLGAVAAPVFLPCMMPLLVIAFYLIELRARLLRRGVEALATYSVKPVESVYRVTIDEDAPLVAPVIHAPTLARGALVSTAMAGFYALGHALWLGYAGGALHVVTRTCGYTLSQIEIVRLPADCHYLCTVAARGHASLVRPLRIGRRAGIPILVNRQLAIANAFEDLLHERVPRFGRLARRIYDRLGLPVSRIIRSRWAADLVFLAMKPAEWAFYLVLLVFDRRSPEERIDRMYR